MSNQKIDTQKLITEYEKGTCVKKLCQMFKVHESTLYGHVGKLVQKGVLKSRRKASERPNRGLTTTTKAKRPNMLVVNKSRDNAPLNEKQYEPLGKAVTIMELTSVTCRFPCGDVYCGADKHGQYSYCLEHCKVAYKDFKGEKNGKEN